VSSNDGYTVVIINYLVPLPLNHDGPTTIRETESVTPPAEVRHGAYAKYQTCHATDLQFMVPERVL
jgi:hypothetical protein